MNTHALRILVVEDEAMIAFFIEDCLIALGHDVVGPTARVANALGLVDNEAFDLALLDINVAGEEIYPVAKALKARGIPFLFLSGYGSKGLRDEWIDSAMLQKPFSPEALRDSIAKMLN